MTKFIYKNLLIKLLFLQLLFSESYLGYIRTIEFSFCMDDCSEFYLETEDGEYVSNIISNNENINISLFINRFVNVNLVNPYLCIECEANLVSHIEFSDQCINPVECIIDPCGIEDCIEDFGCIANYCGGCYADCQDVQLGDINYDGDINILDVVNLVEFVLIEFTPNEYQFNASDIDQNNNLDILDIVALVLIVLYQV